jgi:hypothetical protein
MRNVRNLMLLGLAVLAPSAMSGCIPYSMGIFTPIPIPPWATERMEEKYCWKNDYRTTIMGPIPKGAPPPLCEDPPDDAMVLRAMPHVRRGVPYFCEEFRDDIQVVSELIKDSIDPPRFFPLIGPAQLHHCHYKCTIYYTETIDSGYPFPFRCQKPRAEVIYIDKDHLHLFPGGSPETLQSVQRDMMY